LIKKKSVTVCVYDVEQLKKLAKGLWTINTTLT
jgi:hypothetical protein